MTDETIHVLGYIRVSTEEQATGGYSLDAQEKKIRGYCELHELELVEIRSDPGFSGKNLDRPGIQQVIAQLRRRKHSVDGLVVAKLDRLTRSLKDCSLLIEEFFEERKANKQLFSVEESIDTRRAAGRLILNVIMAVAQWEREAIGDRTKDALQAKIARGERCGRIRFGYDLDADGIHMVPNPREQETIALMRAWRDEGKTYREMAKLIEEMGIRTKEGHREWLPMTIQRILNRPIA
jgi:DNA invertase Pin-like site-specific DNA recombinase